MEMMPYQVNEGLGRAVPSRDPQPTFGPFTAARWQDGLPVLGGPRLTLRELGREDAPALCAKLTTEEVTRFISPPPSSVAGFEKFIGWAHEQRAAGRYACFAVVPEGETRPVGMFQVRVQDADQGIAEWGFVLGSAYWGTGMFLVAARRVVDFAFDQMGMRRLEARACVANGRGTGAIRKLGAVREKVLRGSFERCGERLDQALWTLARHDWWIAKTALANLAGLAKTVWKGTVH